MPISSLTRPLCMENKGFCRWIPQSKKVAHYILLSDSILPPMTVMQTLLGWAHVYKFPKAAELARAWEGVQPEQLTLADADFFALKPGHFDMTPDGGWVWDVACWALSTTPLILADGRPLPLRPDIKANEELTAG